MGYIVDGVYYKGEPDKQKLRSNQQSGWKQWDHNRQRKDFSKDIIQPYDRKGNPNEAFIEAWPEESMGYGFIPNPDDLIKE